MRATEQKNPSYKLVCTVHGILPEKPADHIAATLVRDEHLDDCPAEIEIFAPDQADAFDRARQLDVDDSGPHCSSCLRWLDEDHDECPRCGAATPTGEA